MYISRIGYSQTMYSFAEDGAFRVKFLHILERAYSFIHTFYYILDINLLAAYWYNISSACAMFLKNVMAVDLFTTEYFTLDCDAKCSKLRIGLCIRSTVKKAAKLAVKVANMRTTKIQYAATNVRPDRAARKYLFSLFKNSI